MTNTYNNTSCIVYPVEFPAGWATGRIREPHSTIIFLGDIDNDLGGTPAQEILNALSVLHTRNDLWVESDSVKMFGQNYDIPVLALREHSWLLEMHHAVEDTLAEIGVFSASEFPYNPHVTLDPESICHPPRVLLRTPMLWYGDERYEFGNHLDT